MTTPKAIVQVMGAVNVAIRQFTIQGPGGGGCDSIDYGVLVDSGGSATIEKNHIAHIRDNPLSGCQNGVGVVLGRASQATTGSGTVKDNLIDDFQKGGVVISAVGSDVAVENNTVVGIGPTALIGANGIQVSDGAMASIKNNDISGNVYTPATVVSTGILLYAPGVITVEGNDVSDNDVNIYVFDSSSGASIKKNETAGGTFDGIDLIGSSGVTLDGNSAHDNALDGIFVYEASGNTLKGNDTSSNGEDGINLDGAVNNTLDGNKTNGNGRYGVHAGTDFSAADSTGNTIKSNQAKSNATFDCKDDSVGTGTAGTANTWLNDKGVTSSPAGICKK